MQVPEHAHSSVSKPSHLSVFFLIHLPVRPTVANGPSDHLILIQLRNILPIFLTGTYD